MATPTQIIQAMNPNMFLDPGLPIYLEMAENTTSRGFFQSAVDNGDLAVSLKAMHMWTLAQRTLGESGMVNGKSEGALSIGYAATAKMMTRNDDLDQTHWGKQLINLIKQQSPAASALKAAPSAGDYISPATLSDIASQIIAQQ